MSAKDNGVLRSIHKHDDGSYEVYMKKGDDEYSVTMPTLKAATEQIEEWYQELVAGEV